VWCGVVWCGVVWCGVVWCVLNGVTHIHFIRPILENVSCVSRNCVSLDAFLFNVFLGFSSLVSII